MIDNDVYCVLHREIDKLRKARYWNPIKRYNTLDKDKLITHTKRKLHIRRMYRLAQNMILKGASHSHMRQLARHVYVLQESERHGLDWKQSEIDNNIIKLIILYEKEKPNA